MVSIILLTTFGILNMFLGFLKSNRVLLPLVLFFLAVVFLANLADWNQTESYFNNMLTVDNFAVAFTGVVVLTTLLILPFSTRYLRLNDQNLAEYFALLLFSLVGAVMMVAYENLLMLFIGIEILSICMYVLAGSDKNSLRSNEASLKYFLMGAFATGILLFGIALIYGATGTFYITEIGAVATTGGVENIAPMLGLGLLLVMIGISFKVSAAPFHFWTPDVYEGTPAMFTAFMSTVVKAAGFAAFYKLMSVAFAGAYAFWFPTLAAMAVVTLVVGNIGAAAQESFKRMMAYSSISHAGYLMLALLALNSRSENAIFFYSLAYSVATVAAFGILKLVADQRAGDETYAAFNGLGRTNPLLGVVMTVSMLSLAGIPLTGGFFGKFFIFGSALENDFLWLVVIGILMAMVGIYYYFRVIIAMYLREPSGEPVAVDAFTTFALIFMLVLTVVLGIFPGLFSEAL